MSESDGFSGNIDQPPLPSEFEVGESNADNVDDELDEIKLQGASTDSGKKEPAIINETEAFATGAVQQIDPRMNLPKEEAPDFELNPNPKDPNHGNDSIDLDQKSHLKERQASTGLRLEAIRAKLKRMSE